MVGGAARKKPSSSAVDRELLSGRLKNEINDLGDDRLTDKNDGGEGGSTGRCTRLVLLGGAGGGSKSTERDSLRLGVLRSMFAEDCLSWRTDNVFSKDDVVEVQSRT